MSKLAEVLARLPEIEARRANIGSWYSDFYTHARTDIPDMAAALREAQERIEELQGGDPGEDPVPIKRLLELMRGSDLYTSVGYDFDDKPAHAVIVIDSPRKAQDVLSAIETLRGVWDAMDSVSKESP